MKVFLRKGAVNGFERGADFHIGFLVNLIMIRTF